MTVRTSSRPSPAETPSSWRTDHHQCFNSSMIDKILPIRFCVAMHRFQVCNEHTGINVSFSRSGIARGCLRFHKFVCSRPRRSGASQGTPRRHDGRHTVAHESHSRVLSKFIKIIGNGHSANLIGRASPMHDSAFILPI